MGGGVVVIKRRDVLLKKDISYGQSSTNITRWPPVMSELYTLVEAMQQNCVVLTWVSPVFSADHHRDTEYL